MTTTALPSVKWLWREISTTHVLQSQQGKGDFLLGKFVQGEIFLNLVLRDYFFKINS